MNGKNGNDDDNNTGIPNFASSDRKSLTSSLNGQNGNGNGNQKAQFIPTAAASSADDAKQTRIKKELLDIRNRLYKFFRFMHIVFLVSSLGLIFCGGIAMWIESKMLGNLGLNLAGVPIKLYFVSGGGMIVIAILGHVFVRIRRFKMLTWLLYLLILCVGAGGTGATSFLSLKSYKNHNVARIKLFDLMNKYKGGNGKASQKWDALHQGYHCCGVDTFLDWGESPFGRTSLRTPMSCCRNFTVLHDEFCGQNLLPNTDFQTADEIIFAKGCIEEMLRETDIWYLSSGLYSGFVTFFIGLHWLFCFFLLTSNRV